MTVTKSLVKLDTQVSKGSGPGCVSEAPTCEIVLCSSSFSALVLVVVSEYVVEVVVVVGSGSGFDLVVSGGCEVFVSLTFDDEEDESSSSLGAGFGSGGWSGGASGESWASDRVAHESAASAKMVRILQAKCQRPCRNFWCYFKSSYGLGQLSQEWNAGSKCR